MKNSLDSVLKFLPEAEILFFNNHSTDKSLDIVNQYKDRADLRVLDVEDYTPGRVLNLGAREAKNDILLILSAHCELTHLNLDELIKALKIHKAVFGKQIPIYDGKPVGPDVTWSHFHDEPVVNYFSKTENRHFLHNAICFYDRQFLLENPFDEWLSGKEDRFWANRIVKDGHSYLYNPKIMTGHHFWTPAGSTWQRTRRFWKKVARAIYLTFLYIRARLAMAIYPPSRWPIYVDEYLLRFGQNLQRTYHYPGSFRLSVDVYNAFGHFMNYTKDIPGHIAEFGVYKGGSLVAWAKNLKLMKLHGKISQDKKVYGFDSFSGFPAPNKEEQRASPAVFEGGRSDTSREEVLNYCKKLGVEDTVELVRGYYPQSFKGREDLAFSQVLIDCDLAQSHIHVLEYVYPRMTKGGMIFFAVYQEPSLPEATKVIDKFFANKKEKIMFFPENRKINQQLVAYIIKE